MNQLQSVRLVNWKSICDQTIELQNLNVIVGANGSGKSNLISIFKLLNVMFAHEPSFRTYVGQAGGADSLLYLGRKHSPTAEMELRFQATNGSTKYTAHWAAAAQDSLIFTDERAEFNRTGSTQPVVRPLGVGHSESQLAEYIERTNDKTCKTTLRMLRSCRLYHFHDTSSTSAIRGPSYIDNNRFLYPDASNLASMLYLLQEKYPQSYRKIITAAKQVIPTFHSLLLEPSRLNERQVSLKWFQSGSEYEFGPHQLSDGSIRFLALATLFLQPESLKPLLIAIDEPELGLHPSALEILANMVKAAAQHCQIILATQSSRLLDFFEPENIVVANSVQGKSEFQRLSSTELDLWLEDYSLGSVWEKNIVGGGPYG